MLTCIGASFGSLESTGYQPWFGNSQPGGYGSTAGSRSFCVSARAVLCPTTNSYGNTNEADDVQDCYNAYCTTTTTDC